MRAAIPVLMYHHVSPNPGLVTVSPETFQAQMRHLSEAGYTTLAAADFLELLQGTGKQVRKPVLITFDDGFLDNYVYAFPVLQSFGLRAGIFAVTGWIGEGEVRPCSGDAKEVSLPPTPSHKACKAAVRNGQADDVMLRWSEIRRMQAAGVVEVHSHTHSHVRWDQQYPDTNQRLSAVREDLELSQQTLRSYLGQSSAHLCWPWGYFEPGYQPLATSAGFRAQYTTTKGPNVTGDDPRFIKRIVVKDLAGSWFTSRLWIFSRPLLGCAYAALQRE